MARRKALSGAGAASLAVMATLAGAPAAGAQEVCVICPELPPGGGGGETAFDKATALGFPGATEGVFLKFAPIQPAFFKLGELGFPGGSENVFHKG